MDPASIKFAVLPVAAGCNCIPTTETIPFMHLDCTGQFQFRFKSGFNNNPGVRECAERARADTARRLIMAPAAAINRLFMSSSHTHTRAISEKMGENRPFSSARVTEGVGRLAERPPLS